MKLLLDEMFPAAIATALHKRGYDVRAVQDTPEMRALDDAAVFEAAQREGRAVVTENVKDFISLDANAHALGRPHFGLILTASSSFPRHRRAFIGALTRALAGFLTDHPADDRNSGVWWLQPATD